MFLPFSCWLWASHSQPEIMLSQATLNCECISFGLYHVRLLIFHSKPSPQTRHFYVLHPVNLLNHCNLLKELLYPVESESCWTMRFYRKGHSFSILREITVLYLLSLTHLQEHLKAAEDFLLFCYTVSDRITVTDTLKEIFYTISRHRKEQWGQVLLCCARATEKKFEFSLVSVFPI